MNKDQLNYDVGDEVEYVGPKSNSEYGGSLSNYEGAKLIVEGIRSADIDRPDNIYVTVRVIKSGSFVWNGRPCYFQLKNEAIKKISENYNI